MTDTPTIEGAPTDGCVIDREQATERAKVFEGRKLSNLAKFSKLSTISSLNPIDSAGMEPLIT